jgi:hypothetical protein
VQSKNKFFCRTSDDCRTHATMGPEDVRRLLQQSRLSTVGRIASKIPADEKALFLESVTDPLDGVVLVANEDGTESRVIFMVNAVPSQQYGSWKKDEHKIYNHIFIAFAKVDKSTKLTVPYDTLIVTEINGKKIEIRNGYGEQFFVKQAGTNCHECIKLYTVVPAESGGSPFWATETAKFREQAWHKLLQTLSLVYNRLLKQDWKSKKSLPKKLLGQRASDLTRERDVVQTDYDILATDSEEEEEQHAPEGVVRYFDTTVPYDYESDSPENQTEYTKEMDTWYHALATGSTPARPVRQKCTRGGPRTPKFSQPLGKSHSPSSDEDDEWDDPGMREEEEEARMEADVSDPE